MQNQIQVFENKEFGKVRVVEKDGQPWFVANDVCDVFGETNRNRTMQALDKEEKGYTQMTTPGGKQRLAIVNESGLYAMLFHMQPSKARSADEKYITERKTKLRAFRRWVTSDVLPSIRKHGAYITDETLRKMRDDEAFTEGLIARLSDERAKNSALLDKVEKLAPKARYYDVILHARTPFKRRLSPKITE